MPDEDVSDDVLAHADLAGYPYAMDIADYDTLKLTNDCFDQIDIQDQQDVLQDLAQKRFAFLMRANDIDYVLEHLSDFSLQM